MSTGIDVPHRQSYNHKVKNKEEKVAVEEGPVLVRDSQILFSSYGG